MQLSKLLLLRYTTISALTLALALSALVLGSPQPAAATTHRAPTVWLKQKWRALRTDGPINMWRNRRQLGTEMQPLQPHEPPTLPEQLNPEEELRLYADQPVSYNYLTCGVPCSLKRVAAFGAIGLATLSGVTAITLGIVGLAIEEKSEPYGTLNQLQGPDGCITAMAVAGCTEGQRLIGRATAGVVSPDGRHYYLGSGDGIAVFSRNTDTGALTEIAGTGGCVSPDGTENCTPARQVDFVVSLAISPDGSHLYSATPGGGIAAFARDAETGALTQLADEAGCVNADGSNDCTAGRAVGGTMWAVTVSADGQNVYGSSGSGLSVFARDSQTGALSQLDGTDGCINTYGSEGCATGRAMHVTVSTVISSDGNYAYSASYYGGIAILARNSSTGALTQLAGEAGCITNDGSQGCASARAIDGVHALTLSPDSSTLYTAAVDGIAVFARNAATGSLSQLAGKDGCVSNIEGDSCNGAEGMSSVRNTVVSGDGKNFYVASDDGITSFSRSSDGSVEQLSNDLGSGCITASGDGVCKQGRAMPPSGLAISPDDKTVYSTSPGAGVGVFARKTTAS